MPGLYTENSERWKSLASVDYITQFVKAWIAFNAWYKNSYSELVKTDREAIDEIRSRPNKFRDKLISLLGNQDNDSVAFRSRVAELHMALERKHLFNKGDRITFENIVIENNPITQSNFSWMRMTYKVERRIAGRSPKEIQIFIVGNNGVNKFSYTQPNGFNIEDLLSHRDFIKLSQIQQSNLKACYEQINPLKPINLLSSDPSNCIQMGNLHFIKDSECLCKGIIEILYKLRNILFHGEIIPDSEANKVYEPAYQILYTLIQFL